MPVRNTGMAALARALHGGLSFNAIDDIARLGSPAEDRVTISVAEYEEQFGRLFEALVDAVDWSRVVLEATVRHIALEHSSAAGLDHDTPCGECIAEALLCPDTWRDWSKQPRVERLPTSTPQEAGDVV